jgi:CheY-like chemotaxis protein
MRDDAKSSQVAGIAARRREVSVSEFGLHGPRPVVRRPKRRDSDEAPAHHAPVHHAVAPPAPSEGQAATILVVEDDTDVRDLVISVLSDLGYCVLTASDGPTALDILREPKGIDLLFTDLVMPGGLSGTELADMAVGMRPQLKVLFTSGYIGHPVLATRPILLTDAFIEKPYRTVDLTRKIRSLLEER